MSQGSEEDWRTRKERGTTTRWQGFDESECGEVAAAAADSVGSSGDWWGFRVRKGQTAGARGKGSYEKQGKGQSRRVEEV